MKQNKAYFLVRAQVSQSDRVEFDYWYGTVHLPLAVEKLQAEKAWRFWSRSEPFVHYALYEFSDIENLQRRIESADFKLLVADFDKAWPQVPRTRDLMELAQAVEGKLA